MSYNPRGIGYLRNKLELKRTGVAKRYKYYELKNYTIDFGISTPPSLRNWNACVGWCSTAVDSLADRLQFREFRNDGFGLNQIYAMNNPDVLFDSAVLSALISSCCFIYISADEEGFPRMQVIDGGNATGILDPITYMLNEGYAVLARDDNDKPTVEAYFVAGRTEIYTSGAKGPMIIPNKAPYALLVPIIYRPDAKREFGHSRISRACMNHVDSAIRTIKRSEIAAEFYSFPQKYVNGISEEVEIEDKWKAAMSAMLTFTKDEDGDKPTVGQFQTGSMTPHIEQIKTFASLFAGETGLTLDDLGFAVDNPSSAEAIKASHEKLRLTASKAQRTFGSGFLNAGFLAACVRDDVDYRRDALYRTKPIWRPVFEPDAAMLSLIGDGAIKINQAIPGFFNETSLEDLTGIKPAESGGAGGD